MPYSQIVTIHRRRRRLRFLRAVWRDSNALLREFRIPILIFFIVTFVGGWLYAELYDFARGETIAWIDRPYIMLQLMVMEPPEDAPPEWYLVIFWYLLPPIFIFIVGRGTADFVRLFFNRDARQDSWRAAVASTYRNHIIVFGAGHVGMRVIRALVRMNLDVIAIDKEPDLGVDDELNKLHVPLIVGDGRVTGVLDKAGLRYAESLVVCTGDDHINLETIMKARDMNPDIRIVARVWDDQFARQIERFMNVQTVLSSSDLAAPAFAGAALGIEITQTLVINGVDYSMVRLTVMAGSFMDGAQIGALQSDNDMDIVLHGCGETVDVHPPRDLVVRAGDMLVIFARHDRILNVVARNRVNKRASRQADMS